MSSSFKRSQKIQKDNSSWYGRFSKTLKNIGVTWDEFKANPATAMSRDPGVFKWLTNKWEVDEPIKWWDRPTTLQKDLTTDTPEFFAKLIEDKHPWVSGNMHSLIIILILNFYFSDYHVPDNEPIDEFDEDDIDESAPPPETNPIEAEPQIENTEAGSSDSASTSKTAPQKPSEGPPAKKPKTSPGTDEPPTKKAKGTPGDSFEESPIGNSSVSTSDPATTGKPTGLNKIGVASGIAETTSIQPNITGTGQVIQQAGDLDIPQQVDTSKGPAPNTQGSLPGEAGNRQIQKQAVKFGVLKVSDMSRKLNNILCLAYADKKQVNLFCDLIDAEWSQVSYTCTEVDNKHIDNPFKKLYFVLCNLTFSVNMSTLVTRFGKCITQSVYCYFRKATQDEWDNEDNFIALFKQHLANQLEADVTIPTYIQGLEAEEKRKAYAASSAEAPVVKKRRL